jgi:hypothetical protein
VIKYIKNPEIDFFTIEKLSNIHFLCKIVNTAQYFVLCPTEDSSVSLVGGQ